MGELLTITDPELEEIILATTQERISKDELYVELVERGVDGGHHVEVCLFDLLCKGELRKDEETPSLTSPKIQLPLIRETPYFIAQDSQPKTFFLATYPFTPPGQLEFPFLEELGTP